MAGQYRPAAAPCRLCGVSLDHPALGSGAPDHQRRQVRNVENGRRCRGHAHQLLPRRVRLGDGRPRDGVAAGGSPRRLSSVPARVFEDQAARQDVFRGAVARSQRDGLDGCGRARSRVL